MGLVGEVQDLGTNLVGRREDGQAMEQEPL